MAFEMVVGLLLVDEGSYRLYREAMTPILESYGGTFRYDFTVARVLKTQAPHDINRLFTISFPDRETKERFFADPKYLAIRKRFYEPAVKGRVVVAEYER
jgi:uncharacterized protein (DUF1330 family)